MDERNGRVESRLTRVEFQVDVLGRDVFEILRLIGSWSNSFAPINRLPSELLALLPDFWDPQDTCHARNRELVTLTHVCRGWRELFISRSTLWTKFYCLDSDKTRTYLERSKSSPINLLLYGDHDLSRRDPFLQIVPHAIGRLKSLSVKVVPDTLPNITARLSLPAPLLEYLSIDGDRSFLPRLSPALASTLFNEDLSPLRELRLRSVRTELPWRNMVNLTSFTLAYTPPGVISVRHLLDFFDSAPRLRKVQLEAATLSPGAQDGRLVSLACLKWMNIIGSGTSSLLLNHLLIPVGAELVIQVEFFDPLIEDRLPKYLDNLRNLSGFTEIHLCNHAAHRYMRFGGPNGQTTMSPTASRPDTHRWMLESLAQFDISKVERVEIEPGECLSWVSEAIRLFYQTLLHMKCLRTLVLTDCHLPRIFTNALYPSTSSEGLACPGLEEIVIGLRGDSGTLDIERFVGIAAARAARGAKLKSVRIITQDEAVKASALGLEEHVLRVRCGPDVGGAEGRKGRSW